MLRLQIVITSLLSTLLLAPQGAIGQRPVVYEIPVTGTIELGIAPFIKRSLQEAEKAGARAAILNINTLGGRVDAALQIVDNVTSAKIPVYAFINPRAISAGALIAMAADSVFMVRDALFGASTVVGAAGEKVPEKAQSVMRAQYRALAERRGLDPRVGEAMVDEQINVPGLTEKGQLLTLTAREAVRVGYAIEIEDMDALLESLKLTGAEIITSEANWAEKLVRFFTHPIVASLLLPIGVLGILTEIKTPSFGAAGAVGLLAIGLFFGSHILVGLAGWEELLLLGIGLALIGVEIFLIPGFGIAGILGAASIGASIFLALLGNVSTAQDITRAASTVVVSLALVAVTIIALVRYLPKRKGSGVFLTAATTTDEGFISAQPRTDLLHMEGVTLTDLRPTGTSLIGSERVDVVSDAGFIPKGSRVRVVHAEPYRTVVLPVDEGKAGEDTTINA
jgi:membrane-bound serine protease (ClpP class)